MLTRGLRRLAHLSARLEDGLLVLLLGAMILLAGSQIILRNFFETGIDWGPPLLRVLVLWLALLGGMAATRADNHIAIDLISRFLPEHLKRIADATTRLFTAIVCGIVAWYAAQFVWMEYQDQMILFARVPAWTAEIIIPIGFAIIGLRNLCTFGADLLQLLSRKPSLP
ncbi:MAG: TRAP transporter small permease [Gammaproteobacteria bacterium]|nr:TRAP transporter small permease [Gammaproteobacteria bacterium]MCF6364133.1 TRAP transporter small permease [Gammaproteobacteria bacterium]